MAVTPSTMLELGTLAPDFRLPDTDGRMVGRSDFTDSKALLVAFICNHCPFVKHVRSELARLGRDLQDRGVAVVAISSRPNAKTPQPVREGKMMTLKFQGVMVDNESQPGESKNDVPPAVGRNSTLAHTGRPAVGATSILTVSFPVLVNVALPVDWIAPRSRVTKTSKSLGLAEP